MSQLSIVIAVGNLFNRSTECGSLLIGYIWETFEVRSSFQPEFINNAGLFLSLWSKECGRKIEDLECFCKGYFWLSRMAVPSLLGAASEGVLLSS